jgi:hypothetical protein
VVCSKKDLTEPTLLEISGYPFIRLGNRRVGSVTTLAMWVRHLGDGRNGSCAGTCSFLRNAPALQSLERIASV